MKNFIQVGDTMDVTLAGTKAAGDGHVVGALVGVLKSSGVNGDIVALALKGVYLMPKAAGQAQAQGVVLYWDDTAKVVTTNSNSGANIKIGHAFEAALAGDATTQVFLSR
jgi:predicted RecA/RadA family phage recombinase